MAKNKCEQGYTKHIKEAPEKIHKPSPLRLNYIGSKFLLIDWITSSMLEKTGWTSFANKRIGGYVCWNRYHFLSFPETSGTSSIKRR